MSLSHQGRAVIVSGGTRGIGRAIADGFLEAGARVLAFHRGASPASIEAEASIRKDQTEAVRDGRLVLLRADIKSRRDRRRVLDEVLSRFGRLDVLINSAGVCYRDDLTPARVRDQRTINAVAPTDFAREAAAAIRQNAHASPQTPTRGAIISLSSYVTEWKSFSAEYLKRYAESKRSMERRMRALALELRSDDINVHVVAVGVVYAGMGLATIGRKEEALREGKLPVTKFADVDAVVFETLTLAHPRAHYKTGRIAVLDGGWNLGDAAD
ncbi:SDR family oxidoreductase [Candidatus Poribacteria bacterium]|nr:SDR family oxidoreductase [Candidatus Poribacteria bacterium]